MHLMYFVLGGMALYLCRSLRKTIHEQQKSSRERLIEQMNNDLEILKEIARGYYIILNGEEQVLIDERRDILPIVKKTYDGDSLGHLWNWIPKGHEQSELRTKQYKIRKTLEKLAV